MYQIIQGDCIEGMKTLLDESVHCVVTSPPYYGLRDYGVDGQIGLEDTPEAYVERLVNVFREVRRILRHDGTVWLNLGDSYAGNNSQASNNGRAGYGTPRERIVNRTGENLKPKDLIGIPWRVAFALQADGWWLRQDIIWHKPNPMPESVTDRCTKSHEYIFLLTKSAHYYYDHHAIMEPSSGTSAHPRFGGSKYGDNPDPLHATKSGNPYVDIGTRNRRSVWTVATKPYKEAHFAVFPPKLIEPCVLAGSPTNGVVFDPFTGSGTTAEVALKFGRSFIGTELNPEYVELIHKRLSKISISMFAD